MDFYEALDKVSEFYSDLEEQNQELQERIKTFNKDKELKDKEERIRWLYKNSLYIMQGKESQNEQDFRERHYQKCHNHGHYRYDLEGTGIGTIISITCPICGEIEDITDSESW